MKRIIGTAAGKCSFDPTTQAAVRSEMEILAAAETTEAHGTIDAHSKATTTLMADGKKMVNALKNAMNDGECIVSGY